MKKLFTFVVCILMGGSAFGQELVINGDLEGEQEAGWSSFGFRIRVRMALRSMDRRLQLTLMERVAGNSLPPLSTIHLSRATIV